MASTSSRTEREKSRPEKKIGPFAGGIGVAIWLNTVESGERTRQLRSITINPRRYFDREANEWRDAPSFRPSDLPALIFALERALEFVFTTPVPGENQEEGADDYPF
jgi:hypothetical protein